MLHEVLTHIHDGFRHREGDVTAGQLSGMSFREVSQQVAAVLAELEEPRAIEQPQLAGVYLMMRLPVGTLIVKISLKARPSGPLYPTGPHGECLN